MNRLIIDFETEEALRAFVGWLSDGGGEEGFMDDCDNRELTPVSINYRQSLVKPADERVNIHRRIVVSGGFESEEAEDHADYDSYDSSEH